VTQKNENYDDPLQLAKGGRWEALFELQQMRRGCHSWTFIHDGGDGRSSHHHHRLRERWIYAITKCIKYIHTNNKPACRHHLSRIATSTRTRRYGNERSATAAGRDSNDII
jgi:arylamine N-acetyltransferase